MSEDFAVRLRPVDADVLLAAAEVVVNQDNVEQLLGPGLHARNLNEAARRIEAVADLHRQGIDVEPPPVADFGLTEHSMSGERLNPLSEEQDKQVRSLAGMLAAQGHTPGASLLRSLADSYSATSERNPDG